MDELKRVDTYSLILGSVLLACVLVAGETSRLEIVDSRRAKSGSIVLLVGPSDGGKTAIFSSLVYNHAPPTHTSLQQNVAFFRSPSPFHRKPLQVVDIPGHPRIRGQFTDFFQENGKSKNIGGVKAVIFVCDAAALTRNASTVAEHLHLVMHAISNLPPSATPPPLLVFANKADVLTSASKSKTPNTALAVTRTTTILERELEKRRLNSIKSNTAVLGELGDEGGEDDTVGGLDVTEGDAFTFDKWDGGVVTIRSGWVDIQRPRKAHGGHDTASEDDEPKEKDTVVDPTVPKKDGLAELVDWIATLR
ncbi:SubName: Full=Uncharacterized protein {ECO:0000313/EMBL:CCA73386.1} [Serendipita indica DSM 11827]|uniref:Signal recognition particle receptor subunit beta n=1 Tax=Serendipita indica (strain DSM 11827) TaxID=1109443 RepID=G4TPZ3_SERID|nr:SubName: Full=Uncharacterized protein {ECO:0000313/EMBL:CCA73386.1} [Serendipita indica DSM 11827]CCA73386.1 hypothetical protein PIIN_07340 [Serendipita indica DSM 11827]